MNRFSLIIILVVSLFGCRKIYDPVLNVDNEGFVINGILTNNTEMSKVTISRTTPYNPSSQQQFVSGATVNIYDNDGVIYNLTETSAGIYKNLNLKAEKDKIYFLEVTSPEGDTYKSEGQSLPEKVSIDSIFGKTNTQKITAVNFYGDYYQVEKAVIETYINLSNSLPETPKCRFDVNVTVVYIQTTPLPSKFIWWGFKPNSLDITSTKYELSGNQIKKHTLCSLLSDVKEYAGGTSTRNPNVMYCFVIRVDKYDLASKTFKYYEKINQQLQSSGKIFDPTASQIEGNITCTNNPEKLVLGMFEVSNGEKYNYILKYNNVDMSITKKDYLKNFTESGESDTIPKFLR